MNQAVAAKHHEMFSSPHERTFLSQNTKLAAFQSITDYSPRQKRARDYFFVQRLAFSLHLAEKKLTVGDGWHQLFVYFHFTREQSWAGPGSEEVVI